MFCFSTLGVAHLSTDLNALKNYKWQILVTNKIIFLATFENPTFATIFWVKFCNFPVIHRVLFKENVLHLKISSQDGFQNPRGSRLHIFFIFKKLLPVLNSGVVFLSCSSCRNCNFSVWGGSELKDRLLPFAVTAQFLLYDSLSW